LGAKAKQLEVAIDGKFHELESEPGGYFPAPSPRKQERNTGFA